jgi:UDP-N-acetylglucosamine 2-epimerase (non-hydrolysing)
VTDSICDYFFTTSEVANGNLKNSGATPDRIFFVGNTMIDTLYRCLPGAIKPALWNEVGLKNKNYYVLTLHRPSNVDDFEKFSTLISSIDAMAKTKIIFPVHPRTKKNLNQLNHKIENIVATDPMSYLEFIFLLKWAKGVITDSGGVQEETTVLGIPCITLRKNTERPETVDIGTNQLVGENTDDLKASFDLINNGDWKKGSIPPLWDGRTAERIVDIVAKNLKG